ncbi:anaerobic C4-dicarboxylate transporter family protein [Endozoicomonas numazuensis]|uniref:Uncharacterized protein n=1 Tax=Endozoicomonas numazuensis TaxID=1137799 RepID=A0A081NHY1_9GAMM|nr:anaerobic C4-dicarboxylate transporter family protein [Endozoicomonas numazuensis]KEQ18054.1 hypothetical protein GZ78_10755 [Endozoicomonas numazuensis]
MEPPGIQLIDILSVTIPSTVVGLSLAVLITNKLGNELSDDSQYQKKLEDPECRKNLSCSVDAPGGRPGIAFRFTDSNVPCCEWVFFCAQLRTDHYGPIIASLDFDRTGTIRIGRYVLNHSFMLPGLMSISFSVVVGFFVVDLVL